MDHMDVSRPGLVLKVPQKKMVNFDGNQASVFITEIACWGYPLDPEGFF